MKEIAEFFAASWKEYLAAALAFSRISDELTLKERNDWGTESYLCVFPKKFEDLDKVARVLLNRLAREASQAFAPAGSGSIEIDKEAFMEKFYEPCRRDGAAGGAFDGSKLDPVAAWEWLEATYGGNKGEQQGYEEAAGALYRLFRMERDQEVKIVAGRIVLSQSVYLDDFDLRHFKRKALSHSSLEDLTAIGKALKVFGNWAENAIGSTGDKVARAFQRTNRVEARERIQISDDLEVITFSTRFEYRFSQELASQLQVFLGTYGPCATEKAA